MNTEEFIKKWRYLTNYLGLPAVGIHVEWDMIALDSKVETMNGNEAWEQLFHCTPPWFKKPQTFKELSVSKNKDYQQIAKEETDNGKISYYKNSGLQEPFFCAFTKCDRSFVLLGDGNHRFFDAIYLIDNEKQKLSQDIQNATLDIIYLENFIDVLRPDLIWENFLKNYYHG